MSTEQQEILRAKVNMETSRIEWKELQQFFASGLAVRVSTTLDLVEVALQMSLNLLLQYKDHLIFRI